MEQIPSPDLYSRVINRINYEHKIFLLKRKLFGYLAGLAASLLLFIPLAQKFHEDAARSGMLQIFSLLFSDWQIVAENFGDFSWSVLESIPTASSALAILALIAFIFSSEKIFRFWLEFRSLRQLNKINTQI